MGGRETHRQGGRGAYKRGGGTWEGGREKGEGGEGAGFFEPAFAFAGLSLPPSLAHWSRNPVNLRVPPTNCREWCFYCFSFFKP